MDIKFRYFTFIITILVCFGWLVSQQLNIFKEKHQESTGLNIPELVSVLDLGMTSESQPVNTGRSEELLTKTEKRYSKDLIYTSEVFNVIDTYSSDETSIDTQYYVVLSKEDTKFTVSSKGLYDYVSNEDTIELGCIVDPESHVIHDVYFGDKMSGQYAIK